MATLEELEQQINDLRALITTDYQPPTGPEVSFPVVNQPMNDHEWGALAKAWGSGIISFGQYPYRLFLDSDSDVTNQVRITPATDVAEKDSVGVVEGFAHRLMEDKKLTIDPVTTRTRYIIALQYDPVRVAEGGMPVILDVFAGTLDQSQGKKYVLIYEGFRDPSTVLSEVSWKPVRSRLAPTITVHGESHRPNPHHSGLIWGTRCYCTNDRTEWMLVHHPTEDRMMWERLSEWTDWTNPGDTPTYKWPGHGYRRGYRYSDTSLELRGRIAKSDGSDFVVGGGGDGKGYQLYAISAEGAIPRREQRFITASAGTNYNRLCAVTVTTDGLVYGVPLLGSVGWLSLDGIRVSLED